MKKRYQIIPAAAGVCLAIWILSAAAVRIRGNYKPWELTWSREEEMPYFRSAAHLKIQLKEGADSSQIKVFVNSRQQDLLWLEEKTTELFFEEEGFYEVEIRHKDGEYYHRRIYVELSDPSAPKISTGGYKEGIWTKEDVALKLLGAKSLTGIDHYEYRREGGEWKEVLDEKIFLDETMDERVQARAVSKAGRQGEISEIRIKIWKIRPNKVKLYCKEKSTNGWFRKIPVIYWEHQLLEGGPETKLYFELICLDSGKKKVTEGEIPEIREEGRYQLSAWAKDEAGNRSETTEPLNLWIDFGAPEISIWGADQIKNGFCRRKQTVCIWINDKNITPSSLKIQTSGKRLLGWKPMGNGYYTAVVFQKQGKHYLKAEARDQGGNKTEKKMTFVLDDQKPEICIRGIENHKTYRKNIKPEISIRDENLYRSRIEILCGGEKITDRILSRDGHYTITAAAEDKAGNRTEVKKVFTINKAGILISFQSPEINGKIINKKKFQPSFLVKSMDPVQVIGFMVNGRSEACESEKDIIRLKNPLEENGPYEIRLILSDASGNYGISKNIKFTYDTKPPEIQILGLDPNGKISYGKEIWVSLRQKEDILESVCIDGKKAEIVEGKAKAAAEDLGRHRLSILARDMAGNEIKKEIWFTVEKAVPQIIKEAVRKNGTGKGLRCIFYGGILLAVCGAGAVQIIKKRGTRL